MSLRVSFELDEDDLRHFRLIMRAARKTVALVPPEDIVATAEKLLNEIGDEAPRFVVDRLARLKRLIDMMTDIDWRLPQRDANRVLNALAYFTEPDDLIPDHIPGLGFLDDAIMIELVVRELRHEIEAYEDFTDFRSRMRKEKGHRAGGTRESWLEQRRRELQERMRRRRKRSESNDTGAPRLFRRDGRR